MDDVTVDNGMYCMGSPREKLSDFIYLFISIKEDFMKIIKRIIAIILLLTAVLAVSYLIYTGGQVNA